MSPPLTVNHLSHAGKDALIHSLLAEIQALTTRAADLEARSGGPPKTPGNASVPPSKGQKVMESTDFDLIHMAWVIFRIYLVNDDSDPNSLKYGTEI